MDDQIRLAAFSWLENLTSIHGEELPWSLIHKGFYFQNERIIPIGQPGIWKPRIMELPLSITTSHDSHYPDTLTEEGLRYSYRGTDPTHRDNVGLRRLMQMGKPLIYFLGVSTGSYIVKWPVFVQYDNVNDLYFTVAIDDLSYVKSSGELLFSKDPAAIYRRKYVTSKTLVRLHQVQFRKKVLHAYGHKCTLCNLRHEVLLDAAHIIGDREDMGDPIVTNGLSLCKIHHVAFDKYIIGITPDYEIKVRKDILEEVDGPMLKYGLQSLDTKPISLPRRRENWPDKERLKLKFEAFTKTG